MTLIPGSGNDRPRQLQDAGNRSNNNRVFISGLFDTDRFWWGEELFEGTIALLRNHSNGFHDDIFLHDNTIIEYRIDNAACDGTRAAQAYWLQRTQNGGVAPHVIAGPRCSSSAVTLATIAGLEKVPLISMSATTSQLSDNKTFSNFARTVSPKEAEALVAMLRKFGWDNVSSKYRKIFLKRLTRRKQFWLLTADYHSLYQFSPRTRSSARICRPRSSNTGLVNTR